MDIQIELSAAQWHTLLGHLDPTSPVYSIVKSAIEINEASATTPLGKVVLTCNGHDAAAILKKARKSVPQAASTIEAALETGRET